MIELHAISKIFSQGKSSDATQIKPFDRVSFDIENGEKIGLIGASGEGKSTLANILCGICAPSEGKVYIEGVSLWNDKGKYDRKRGKEIQLIPQKPLLALDPMQTIGSAVKEALIASKNAKFGKDATQKAKALFDLVGLEWQLASRLPMHLSGGQAQRAVIARALATKPQLLISDESTSMLDEATQNKIIDLYDTLVKDSGISVLLITHDVSLAESFCDTIYLLKDSTLCEYLENKED